jgi:hypothetical protein
MQMVLVEVVNGLGFQARDSIPANLEHVGLRICRNVSMTLRHAAS